MLEGIGIKPLTAERPVTANWKILRALVVVGASTLVAKLVGTGKELAVANWFGRSDSLDAFLIAMVLPSTVVGVVSGSLNAALIPHFIQVRETQGQEAAQQLFSSVQVATILLLVTASILLTLGAPYYLPLLGSGFGAAKLQLTQRLLYLLLPFVVLSGAIVVWSSILNAGEKFALPALTPAVTPLVTVGALIWMGHTWGIFALVAGTLCGTILEVSLLGWALHGRGLKLRFRWHGFTPELRLVLRQYVPMVAGMLVVSTSPLIDQAMAAMLQRGSVAALSFGYKITAATTTLTMAALSTAVLPYFSRMVADKNWGGCRRTLRVYSFLVLAATIPISAGLIAGSRPLVRLLYQRGAFTESDTAVVSTVQVFFAFVIPFSTWSVLFVRLLSALRRSDILAYGTLISATLNVLLNIVLMKRLGVAGIALSTSLVAVISCFGLGFVSRKLLGKQEAVPEALQNTNGKLP